MNKNKDNKKSSSPVLPVPTIRRLPLYLSFLKSVKDKKSRFISAPEIARELHIDPTQITKDFSYIDVRGRTRVGYEIDGLIQVMMEFLGHHESDKAFIIGVGNLGMALVKYNGFIGEGLEIIAGFDIDSEKIGMEINGIKIHHLENIRKIFDKTPVDIGIITVQSENAQKVTDTLVECGIKAIWNFSAIPLSAPENIIVVNTSIESGLAIIKWKLNNQKPMIYKNRIL